MSVPGIASRTRRPVAPLYGVLELLHQPRGKLLCYHSLCQQRTWRSGCVGGYEPRSHVSTGHGGASIGRDQLHTPRQYRTWCSGTGHRIAPTRSAGQGIASVDPLVQYPTWPTGNMERHCQVRRALPGRGRFEAPAAPKPGRSIADVSTGHRLALASQSLRLGSIGHRVGREGMLPVWSPGRPEREEAMPGRGTVYVRTRTPHRARVGRYR
eukprot:1477142-Rhodomonas_salina.3